jgi:hypothetical protein
VLETEDAIKKDTAPITRKPRLKENLRKNNIMAVLFECIRWGILKVVTQGHRVQLKHYSLVDDIIIVVARETMQLQDDTEPPAALYHSHQTWQTRDEI